MELLELSQRADAGIIGTRGGVPYTTVTGVDEEQVKGGTDWP